MKTLINRFSGIVKGTISGFDRIVFKGLILPLMSSSEVMSFCRSKSILNKDYKQWWFIILLTHKAEFSHTTTRNPRSSIISRGNPAVDLYLLVPAGPVRGLSSGRGGLQLQGDS